MCVVECPNFSRYMRGAYLHNILVNYLSYSFVAISLWLTTGLACIYVPWPHCFV